MAKKIAKKAVSRKKQPPKKIGRHGLWSKGSTYFISHYESDKAGERNLILVSADDKKRRKTFESWQVCKAAGYVKHA